MSSENLFSEPNLGVLRKALIGRSLLGVVGEGAEMEPADVYVVQSLLAGAGLSAQEKGRSQLFKIYFKSIATRVFQSSWATHWALEIRGDYYELERIRDLKWPFWGAVIALNDKEDDDQEGPRQIVRRFKIGTTRMSNVRIAEKGLRYKVDTRGYSLFGDNCQQFILNFCEDICVDIDPTVIYQLTTAPHLIKWLANTLYVVGAASSADLFLNRGRLLVKHIEIPITGLCMLTVMTVAHPRMYSARLHQLPFQVAHGLYLLHVGVVWGLWVLFCASIWALTGKLWIFGAGLIGPLYHSTYSFNFVQQA